MSRATELEAENHVSELKKADVKKLLKGIYLTKKAAPFYGEVIGGDLGVPGELTGK